MQIHGDNPKSFYRKSVRSVKSSKQIDAQSDGDLYSDQDSQQVPSSSEDEAKTLSSNYDKLMTRQRTTSTKFIEDISNVYNIAEFSDNHDIDTKLRTLKSPEKRFINYERKNAYIKILK